MARKSFKVTIDDVDFYFKMISPGTWGAFQTKTDVSPVYTIQAPEDATPGELESELDYLLMEESSDETEESVESEYFYSNW